MKNKIERRLFLKKSVLTGIAGMFTASSPARIFASNKLPDKKQGNFPEHLLINLTENPSESIAATWRTKNNISQYIQWCIACDSPIDLDNVQKQQAQSSPVNYKANNIVTNHSITINKLKPNTQYLYRVGAGESWSEWFEFTTAGLPNEPFSFVYFGDVQNGIKSQCSRVIRKAYATAPDAGFFLYAGDLINHAETDEEWSEWFDAGSFIHATIPSTMTPGNHEYGGKNGLDNHWRPQFTLPQNGPETNLCSETAFYSDYHNLRIISIDSKMITRSDEVTIKTQEWLSKILREKKDMWTVLTLHYPFYSTKSTRDNPDLRANFQPIIEKYHVDLVLTGHDHAYGRGMKNIKSITKAGEISGPVYVVSVCGIKQYSLSNKSWMTRKGGNTQLFQVISVNKNKLNFKAYMATGKLYDEFDLIKRTRKPNKLVERIPDTPERLYTRP